MVNTRCLREASGSTEQSKAKPSRAITKTCWPQAASNTNTHIEGEQGMFSRPLVNADQLLQYWPCLAGMLRHWCRGGV